jgi:sugar lactone lactonase YvrE
VGGANIYRVTPEGDVTVYAEGFTNIIDLSFDEGGNLYVLEMTAGGLGNANPDDPATLASRVTKVAPNGSQQVIIDVDGGLVFATGLTVGPDGALYVSNFGVMPGLGQVVRYDLTPEAAPEQ